MILATCYFEAGKKAKGKKLWEELRKRNEIEYIPPMGFFYINHVQKKSDQAFAWLEKACVERDSFLPWCKIIPFKDYQLPDEPRVHEVLKKAGLE
jgi:hypothetical protein